MFFISSIVSNNVALSIAVISVIFSLVFCRFLTALADRRLRARGPAPVRGPRLWEALFYSISCIFGIFGIFAFKSVNQVYSSIWEGSFADDQIF